MFRTKNFGWDCTLFCISAHPQSTKRRKAVRKDYRRRGGFVYFVCVSAGLSDKTSAGCFKHDGVYGANIALAYAGLAGAYTNTLFVMSGIFILYKEAYAQAVGVAGEAVLDVIMGVVTFNGVVEAVVAAIIVAGVGIALTRVKPVYSRE